MNIGIIVRRLNVKGGTQRQALALGLELKRRGHDVRFFTFTYAPEDSYGAMLKEFPVVTWKPAPEDIPAPKFTSWIPRYFRALIAENHTAREFVLQMPKDLDLLNPHDSVSHKVATYYKKLQKHVPSVWHMNDCHSLRWGYDKLREVDESAPRISFLKRIAYWLLDTYDRLCFIKFQDAIIVVDNFNREISKRYLHREPVTVRSGPDTEHFMYTKHELPSGKAIKILTSGIFMPHRRYQDTITAVSILRHEGYFPTLTIVGDYGSDRKYYEKLEKLVEELRIKDHVQFAGRVSEEDLLRIYRDHHVYIFQHHLQSDGLSPYEAAVSGLPIIVSRTAGCHEALTDRENTLLINPKDPKDIAEKVRELVDNPELYRRLAEAGGTFVRKNFSWQKYADGVLRVFEAAGAKYKS